MWVEESTRLGDYMREMKPKGVLIFVSANPYCLGS